MKIRTGFVSNSSSSSFMIAKEDLTVAQQIAIFEHYKEAGSEAWTIEDEGFYIHGFTWLDNFDMEEYLERIGVSSHYIDWDNG